MSTTISACLLLLFASTPQAQGSDAELVWNERTAEHLLNRAGFGASPEEIARALDLGPAATVDELLGTGAEGATRANVGRRARPLRAGLTQPESLTRGPVFGAEPPAATTEAFYLDRGRREALGNIRDYCSEWIGSMLRSDDPVRDRMAIFWHGHFVSAFETVQDDHDMIHQVDFLRTGALGNFGELVRGIARDPAMLEYLNNNLNDKAHPNENWARELMELFTLGEGNYYTEDDIKEAARAFTGWANRDHEFIENHDLHDYGFKELLGVHGNLDGDLVIDILLEHPGTADFVAWKILSYFEGLAPSDERAKEYAQHLRANDYNVAALLRRLFLDPAFYREEVRGTRVAAPVEYFVGISRRLGIEPPANLVFFAASLLGQRLFDPPNVKGWEEGMPWMTTGSVMQRSNLLLAFLGQIDEQSGASAKETFDDIVALRGREFTGPFRDFLAMQAWFEATDWQPERMGFAERLRASKAPDEAEFIGRLLERLLAVPPALESRARVLESLNAWRAQAQLEEGALLEAGEASDALLVRLAHLVLSLPEAQLN